MTAQGPKLKELLDGPLDIQGVLTCITQKMCLRNYTFTYTQTHTHILVITVKREKPSFYHSTVDLIVCILIYIYIYNVLCTA